LPSQVSRQRGRRPGAQADQVFDLRQQRLEARMNQTVAALFLGTPHRFEGPQDPHPPAARRCWSGLVPHSPRNNVYTLAPASSRTAVESKQRTRERVIGGQESLAHV